MISECWLEMIISKDLSMKHNTSEEWKSMAKMVFLKIVVEKTLNRWFYLSPVG